MTDETNSNDEPVDMDDLDAFEDTFFEREKAEEKVEEKVEEESAEIEEDSLATEEEPAEDDEEAEEEDDDSEEDEEEEEPEPKPEPKAKRNRTQERIEKLVAEAREAERRAEALEQRLAELEAGKPEDTEEEAPEGIREKLAADAPNPDAKDKEGEPIYPLGEFDPKFIRDLTRFTIEQEFKATEEARAQEAQAREIAEAQQELADQWADRVEKAEADIPDLREKLEDLTETFQHMDPAYGEYLAATIMGMDAGPQIMYYLSQNIGEAQKIVASGPAAATLAIGRLDARLAPSTKAEPKRNKEVSKAPPPPEDRARGRGGRFTVSPDTDDLDAFEREFYNK